MKKSLDLKQFSALLDKIPDEQLSEFTFSVPSWQHDPETGTYETRTLNPKARRRLLPGNS